MAIQYLQGDVTDPSGEGSRIVVQLCNDLGAWEDPWLQAVSRRWRQPEKAYKKWFKENGCQPLPLGEVQFVEVEPQLWVASLIGLQRKGRSEALPLVPEAAIRQGLKRIALLARTQGCSIHMSRLGTVKGAQAWTTISRLVKEELIDHGLPVTVYDPA
jgi:hypothetical protein